MRAGPACANAVGHTRCVRDEVVGGSVVKMMKLSSALALVAMIPCIGGAQRPAAPAARDMVVRTMVGPRTMPAMMMDAASMFLGCTGELQLTDAQVTKLAAIARRAESRQAAIRSRMDSAMTVIRSGPDGAAMPRDGAAAGGMMMTMMRMPMTTDAERKAQHEDDRDAFAVLTPDQLATAWEMMAKHHGMAPGKM